MDDPVANFMAMTSCDSEDVAVQYLSRTDFDLIAAVTLYQADSRDAAPRPAPRTVNVDSADDPLDPFSLHAHVESQEPTPATATTSTASPTHIATRSAHAPLFPSHPLEHTIDNPDFGGIRAPFLDDPVLSGMFATPAYVNSNKPLESVCSAARRKNVWVLVVLRDASFVSTCVSRDLWRLEAMPTIASSLECAEYDVSTPLGQLMVSSFRMERAPMPVMLLIDPNTMHKELDIKARPTPANGIDGAAVVDQILLFIATEGAPGQWRPSKEHSEGDSRVEEWARAQETVNVDDEDDDDDDDKSGGGLGPSARVREDSASQWDASPQQTGSPPPAPQVAAVSLEEWTLAADDASGYKLRVRLPKSSPTLNLRPETPVTVLLRYLAYRVYAEDPGTYTALPAVEVRAGFPPKCVAQPASDDVPLSAWQGVRSGEALTVHIKL